MVSGILEQSRGGAFDEDLVLVDRVLEGDEEAFQALYTRYYDKVFAIAKGILLDSDEAADAVQEIFIELWSHANRFDENKASETTFIAMLARRRLIDRLRKTKREPSTEELNVVQHVEDSDQIDSSEQLETQDQAERARRLIRTLKPEQQQIIQLAVYDGHTHQSIADAMGLPLGTVKTHLRRGLLRVREAMEATT